jgi:ketosteroid isomerase-like protein
MKNAADIALEFVGRINRHDVAGLAALMTEDHRFVDGLGQEVRGREQMEKGWLGYFAWFPDYAIKVDDTLSGGNVVALFGTAQGTYRRRGTCWRRRTGKFRRHGRQWYATGVSRSGVSMPITSRSGR